MTLEAIGNHLWQSTAFAALVGLATLAFRNNRATVRHALWLVASTKFLVPFAVLIAAGQLVGQLVGLAGPMHVVQRQMAFVFNTFGQPFTQIEIQPAGRLFASRGPQSAFFTIWGGSTWEGLQKALPSIVLAVWAAGSIIFLAAWWIRWRRVAAIARAAAAIEVGRELDALRRIERKAGLDRPIALVAADASFEPGIFGILRPVLLWPQKLATQFDDDQMLTILAHEVAHVRRCDNLASALHMVVEAVFWFHPLVWWIGGRLIDERERACDEEVLGWGHEPEVYAESILKSCRACIESPLPCVAGVTGSNLKTRIERIMTHGSKSRLTPWKWLLLVTLASAPVATPIVVGAASPRVVRTEVKIVATDQTTVQATTQTTAPATAQAAAQTGSQTLPQFEVASIKPNTSGDRRVMINVQPGGRFTATNVPLRMLIRNAWQLQDFQIVGGPEWMSDDRFDVLAKADDSDGEVSLRGGKPGQPSRMNLMLQSLLAERFKLQVHNENREVPIYALVLARSDGKLGPAMQKSAIDCTAGAPGARGGDRAFGGPPSGIAPPGTPPPGAPAPGAPAPAGPPGSAQAGAIAPCGIRNAPGNMSVSGQPLSMVAAVLGGFVGRIVVDRTGLTDSYDFTLKWTPDFVTMNRPLGSSEPLLMNGVPMDPNGPSIFTALQEQLGLKLDSQKGPISVLVIDRAEHPVVD